MRLIAAVGDIDIVLGVHGDGVRRAELVRAAAMVPTAFSQWPSGEILTKRELP